MNVIIKRKHKEQSDVFNNVTNIEQSFDFKLGAQLYLKINGKRNKVRIPVIDIKHLSVISQLLEGVEI